MGTSIAQKPLMLTSFLEAGGGKYLEYTPSLNLQPYINKYYITEGFPQFNKVEIHPVGKENIEIHFHYGQDDFKICDKDSRVYSDKRSYIVGTLPFNQLFTTRFLSQMAMLSVELSNLGAVTLLGCYSAELREKIVDTELIFGYSARLLLDNLICALSNEERIMLLDDFFLTILRKAYLLTGKENQLYAYLDSQFFSSVTEISEDLNMHQRSVERYFSTHFGMCPKDYIRIRRLNKACELLSKYPEISISEIISDCHYYDQSHFIREFRQLVKKSPLQYLKQMNGLFYFGRGYIV